jgi:excinuclease ABC subunit A
MQYKTVAGLEHIDKVIEIDQSPIGRTPGATRLLIAAFLPRSGHYFLLFPKQRSVAIMQEDFLSM